jgi:AraC-like DNA-binding protein
LFSALKRGLKKAEEPVESIETIYEIFKSYPLLSENCNPDIERVIEIIFKSRGTISIEEITDSIFITERHLQRLFKKHIGLSPKFYSRIQLYFQIDAKQKFELVRSYVLIWVL